MELHPVALNLVLVQVSEDGVGYQAGDDMHVTNELSISIVHCIHD